MMIDLHDMVREALKARGCDGLCNPDHECWCGIDDLMPCGHASGSCEAARYVPAENCPHRDACGHDCEGGCYQVVEVDDGASAVVPRGIKWHYPPEWPNHDEDVLAVLRIRGLPRLIGARYLDEAYFRDGGFWTFSDGSKRDDCFAWARVEMPPLWRVSDEGEEEEGEG